MELNKKVARVLHAALAASLNKETVKTATVELKLIAGNDYLVTNAAMTKLGICIRVTLDGLDLKGHSAAKIKFLPETAKLSLVGEQAKGSTPANFPSRSFE